MLRLTTRYGLKTRFFPLPEAARIRLGSAPDNDIVLPYAGVSREHAVVLRRSRGLLLRDLGSKNGLVVEGNRVGEVELDLGQTVQVGSGFVTLEELPSSDGVMALSLAEPSSRTSTESFTATSGYGIHEPSARQALRFVRRILDGRRGATGWESTWRTACDLLSADVVLTGCLNGNPARLVVREGSGALSERLLRSLEEILASRSLQELPTEISSTSGRWLIRSIGEGGAVVAAHFAPGALTPWAGELFSFIAECLGADAVAAPGGGVGARNGEIDPPPGMVLGTSAATERLLEVLVPALSSTVDVLLLGETGTGKELYARLIHRSGSTGDGPFVAVNCAAIPADQMEAELFGIGRGIATGVDARPGLFVLADGGTLFLDEIGELPGPLQAKLLRAIQEREVRPVGAGEPRAVSIRLIAASNQDLPAMARDGRFRRDLYYRLQGLELHLPALRERREEIPELVTAFVRESASRHTKRILGVSRRSLDQLLSQPWRGNVRELRAAVERAVLRCPDGGVLESAHFGLDPLPAESLPAGTAGSSTSTNPETRPGEPGEPDGIRPLRARLEVEERRAIREALAATRGNKTRAARLLGVSRPGLTMKMKRLELEC